MALGRPSISTPNAIDLRAISTAVSNTRQRIEAIEAALLALQNSPLNSAAITAALATLQGQVSALTSATGTVTSVGASVPSILSVAGVPIVSAGTIAIGLAAQPKGTALMGPLSGIDAQPVFRSIEWDYDLPLISSLPGTSSGIEGDELVLIERYGTMTWATAADIAALAHAAGGGTVTSVSATVPSFLSVTGVPVTTAGTISIALATQPQSLVFAGPVSGANAAPSFRALQWDYDLPLISSLPFTSGIDGSEIVLIERYGTMLWTTAQSIANLGGGGATGAIFGTFSIPPSTGWSWVNQLTNTVTFTNNHLAFFVPPNGGGTNVSGYLRASPGNDFTATGFFSISGVEGNFGGVGIMIRNSSTGAIQTFEIRLDNPALYNSFRYSNPTTFVSSSFTGQPSLSPANVWLRLQRVSTTLSFFISMDGSVFTQVAGTTDLADYVGNPDGIGIVAYNDHVAFTDLAVNVWSFTLTSP